MNRGIKVLSIFDGISCGRVALERVGINIEVYHAYEIDKNAIKVSRDNYPDIVHFGDVRQCSGSEYNKENFDLLIGGSPCQDLSIASSLGKGLSGKKSSLFFEYLRIRDDMNPKYFLYENVASMKKEDRDIITDYLGVEPIMIDSALVSFQHRKRLYWTNIPNVTQPEDKYISFQDHKSSGDLSIFKVNKTPSREKMWNGACPNVTNRDKINCLTVKQDRWGNAGLVEYEDFCRYLTNEECELAQTLPIGYTKSVSKNARWHGVGNGWTIDVIAHIFKGLEDEIL